MKKISTLLLCIILFSFQTLWAQLNYTAASGVNTTQTYTDLGTNGTAIATSEVDDANSAPQDIGFNFVFNGTTYTQFILNTNGFIKLGAVAPASAGIYDVLLSSVSDVIAAMNLDLTGGTSPEYRVYTSGVAPNRTCTVQFKNVRDFFDAPATAPQFASMQFQIKLYETSNNIELAYGTFVAGSAPATAIGPVAGIKGSDAYSSINVSKSSTSAWSTATFLKGPYTGNMHNIRNSVLPDAGRTYRFVSVALAANDAGVQRLYTLGKIPLNFGAPHVVQSIIRNDGGATLTNLQVTLNVTGANTFTNTQTVASLAPGASATVNFAGFSPANVGTNTVTVTVPADDDNSDNSLATTQAINTNTFSYADNSAAVRSVGFDTRAGIVSTKYYMNGNGSVTDVNVFLVNSASSVGNTVYAVVLNAAGAIVGRSADFVITAGDLNKYKNFSIVVAPSLSNTEFYVGLAQTANATATYNPVGAQNEALPTRSGAFYRGPIDGSTPPTEMTAQGRFMIEAIVTTAPLPVTLADFSGRINGNVALLQWTTSFESNSDKFEIERSSSTGAWTRIGTVAAAGNSTSTKSYNYADPGLNPGGWLYRLKIVDKDGQFVYSSIVTLNVTGSTITTLLQNYPNPVSDVTRIPYSIGKDATITIELYSIEGRKISVINKGLQQTGSYNTNVNARALGLANGKYIYRLVIQDKATGEITTLQKEMNVIR